MISSFTNIVYVALANNVISDQGGIDELSMLPTFIRPHLGSKKVEESLILDDCYFLNHVVDVVIFYY